MSGFRRQVQRRQLRTKYDKFSQEFRREKDYQDLLLGESDEHKRAQEAFKTARSLPPGREKADALAVAGEALHEIEQRILEGKPRLGKKPSFGVFIRAMKQAQQQAAEALAQRQAEPDQPEELEWKEPEASAPVQP